MSKPLPELEKKVQVYPLECPFEIKQPTLVRKSLYLKTDAPLYQTMARQCGFDDWHSTPTWIREEIINQVRIADRALPLFRIQEPGVKLSILRIGQPGKTLTMDDPLPPAAFRSPGLFKKGGMPKTRSLDFKDITKNMSRVEKEIYLMNHPASDLNPWQPMRDKRDKKTIGKLGEEASELVSAICRCMIQGIDGKEPVSGKVNRAWLEEEIADVKASIELTEERFNLDTEFIAARARRKKKHLLTWHAML